LIAVLGAVSITAAAVHTTWPDPPTQREVRVRLADRPRIELGVPLSGDAMSDYRAHVVPRIDRRLLDRVSSASFDVSDPELSELVGDPLVERIGLYTAASAPNGQ